MEHNEFSRLKDDIKKNTNEKGDTIMQKQAEQTVKATVIEKDLAEKEIKSEPTPPVKPEETEDKITDLDENPSDGDDTDAPLPENVDEEPRDDEEMHLGQIKGSSKTVRVYLDVSDDRGEMLGSKALEKKVRRFCRDNANINPAAISNGDQVLQEALKLAKEYIPKVNMRENSLSGTITKYRIRQGMLFNIIRELVKQNENWIEWFKTNFDPREFRSTQDYMRLAR